MFCWTCFSISQQADLKVRFVAWFRVLLASSAQNRFCSKANQVTVRLTIQCAAQGRFADPERLAFREAGPRQPLYRVRFSQVRPHPTQRPLFYL